MRDARAEALKARTKTAPQRTYASAHPRAWSAFLFFIPFCLFRKMFTYLYIYAARSDTHTHTPIFIIAQQSQSTNTHTHTRVPPNVIAMNASSHIADDIPNANADAYFVRGCSKLCPHSAMLANTRKIVLSVRLHFHMDHPRRTPPNNVYICCTAFVAHPSVHQDADA